MRNNILIGDWEKVGSNDKDIRKTKYVKDIKPFEYNSEEKLEPPTDIVKEVIQLMDSDIEHKGNMNSIDFNTHLSVMEIPALTTLQMLGSLGVGGHETSLIAKRTQRNKVSIDRKGRTEKVDIMKGEREREAGNKESNLFGKIKGFVVNSGDK